jgi:hypothetical protein
MNQCPHCGGALVPAELIEDCGHTPVEVCRRCHTTQEYPPTPPPKE